MALRVELVSPERILFEGDATLVIVRTTMGEIGFQTGHVPFAGILANGEARLTMADGTTQSIAVHRGFIELADNHLTILSDEAELAENIDVARATEAKNRAESALAVDDADPDAREALHRAETRLAVAQKS